jgi:hypothetical protein
MGKFLRSAWKSLWDCLIMGAIIVRTCVGGNMACRLIKGGQNLSVEV